MYEFQEREESSIFDILQVFYTFMNMSGWIVGLILSCLSIPFAFVAV